MKFLKSASLIALLLFLSCDSNEKLAVNSTPEKLISEWVAMWNSYDLNFVEKLFLPDSNLTYFSSEKEGLIVGIDSVLKHHEGFGFVKDGKTQPNKLWLEDLKFVDFGSVSIVTGVWYFQKGMEKTEAVQRGPVTFVCVRKDKNYLIAHVNFGNYEN